MVEPKLVMIIEPETKFRFRYASESGSHGGILGRTANESGKAYPAVKLENYHQKRKVLVRVKLCTEIHEPHVLYLAGKHAEGDGMCYKQLDQSHVAEFPNLIIRNLKKDESLRILMERKFQSLGKSLNEKSKLSLEKKFQSEIKEQAKQILNSAVLCFEAFHPEHPEERLCPPLYSEIITNQKSSLKIVRVSRCSGSWKGEDEVILLCDKVKKGEIKVIFSEQDDQGKTIWQGEGKFSPADVHHQVAITFKTPPFKENAKKKVFMSLCQSKEQSEPIDFLFLADDEDDVLITQKKRKRNCTDLNAVFDIFYPSENDDVLQRNKLVQSQNSCDSEGNSSISSNSLLDNNLNGFNESPDMFATLDMETLKTFLTSYDDSITTSAPLAFATLDTGDYQMDLATAVGQMGTYSPIKENKECGQLDGKEKLKKKLALLISMRDRRNNTVLHLAVMQSKCIKHVLGTMRFSSSNIIDVYNQKKKTALHIAAELGCYESAKLLCLSGANPLTKDGNGNNCFHIAAQISSLACLKLFHTYKPAGVNGYNYEGLTPLHIAVTREPSLSSYDCLMFLLENASANMKDKKCGQTPLHVAAGGKSEFIPLLLQKQCDIDVNSLDFSGNTPLHIACITSKYSAVKILLEAGADPSMRNFKETESSCCESINVGQSPLDLSTEKRIIELLERMIREDSEFVNKEAAPFSESNQPSQSDVPLCEILDENLNESQWKSIINCLGFDEHASIFLKDSPANCILKYLKKEYGDNHLNVLKEALQVAELQRTLELLKELHFV